MARYDQGWPGDRRGPSGPFDDERWGRPPGGWFSEGAGAASPPYPNPRVLYGPERYGLGPYHERLRRRRRPDDDIKRDVTDALFYDTWVDADAITVEVQDGIVTLRGQLPDYDEIRYATDDAWDVDGVVGVHSELEVRQ